MEPSANQFSNVINLEQKRKEKTSASSQQRSPFGPIQSNLVKPVTGAPEASVDLTDPSSNEKK